MSNDIPFDAQLLRDTLALVSASLNGTQSEQLYFNHEPRTLQRLSQGPRRMRRNGAVAGLLARVQRLPRRVDVLQAGGELARLFVDDADFASSARPLRQRQECTFSCHCSTHHVRQSSALRASAEEGHSGLLEDAAGSHDGSIPSRRIGQIMGRRSKGMWERTQRGHIPSSTLDSVLMWLSANVLGRPGFD